MKHWWFVVAALFALTALVLLYGCEPKCSTPLATRCSGEVAEICQADDTWATVEDCRELAQPDGGAWACCWYAGDETLELPAGHTCLPVELCGATDNGG